MLGEGRENRMTCRRRGQRDNVGRGTSVGVQPAGERLVRRGDLTSGFSHQCTLSTGAGRGSINTAEPIFCFKPVRSSQHVWEKT